ncbi:MAG TPA: tetratricopeptide repeat protein [Chitinophagaceae bacterium]|nr:tetratricopeptide repeat protein [Chitinophagaceae bacterium]
MDKNLTRILVSFLFIILSAGVRAQVAGLPYELKKPQKYENRVLRSEKTGNKKFTAPRKFMQNTITHYNYYFNANEKIKEVLARAKEGHKDDYTKLLSFYNYNLDETSRFKGDLDSVIYKSTAGILLHDLRNAWIDNLYLLIGRAYYLRNTLDSAHITFQYVNFAFAPKEDDGYDKVIGSNSNEGSLSISTSEKRNIAKKALSQPPSRNDALIWQIRTYLALDQLTEAASLVQALKTDPLFPPRLRTDLNEVQAWYFYKQGTYDSAAIYLEQALGNALNGQERARWEYLIAQLYERNGDKASAEAFYTRAQNKTIDPIMEVYALLNAIRQERGDDDKSLRDAIRELVKMGHRDKYVDYRDIIYYTAGTMENDRKNVDSARLFFGRSIKYSTNNPQQKSKSFLALGDIAFAQKEFPEAKRLYDSVEMNTIDPSTLAAFNSRKQTLTVIARQQEIIARQDSLQRLAALPLAEREAYVKKLARQLRRQQGLKEEDVSFGNSPASINGNNNAPTDLFNSGSATDFYFSNESLKSKGFSDFKSRWGNRPNVDNWQRSAAIQQQSAAIKLPNDQAGNAPAADAGTPALSYESLLKNIPVAPEKLKISNDSIMTSLYTLGKALQDGLEDYTAAIDRYEQLLERFPGSPLEEATLFNLYYCYRQTGNQPKMAAIKKRMETGFANGKLTAKLNNPDNADSAHKKSGEELYDQIYNLFIEGKFDEALAKKHDADSLFGNHFWSPQLLYIEAVYHIQQRNDSTAVSVLNHLVSLYPATAMASRARKLIEVLGRRREIEDYLTNLKIERPTEDSTDMTIVSPTPRQQVGTPLIQDSTTVGKVKAPVNIIRPRADTAAAAIKPAAAPLPSSFSFVPGLPEQVVLVMDKVDPVYVTEAKNAFARYHKEKYADKALEITPLPLTDDIRFMLIGKFSDVASALDYIDKTRKLAATDIIPWMPVAKYTLMLISDANLELLKSNRDLPGYKKFLSQHLPDYFK